MESAWLIDGHPGNGVPPDDRGFAYGDGLFETIAAPGGRPRRFERHYARLSRSCERLHMVPPRREVIEADIARLTTRSNDCVIKVIVTRGSGGRGYRPPAPAKPRRLVGVFPWPDYRTERYRDGVHVTWCATRLAENPALAGIKHLCRLEQVLAQRDVGLAGADEGLMQSSSGLVISGTMSNLFAVLDSVLVTPRLDRCGVAGVMRGAIMDAARSSGIGVVETELAPESLATAEELFLSNAVFGIWPVCVLGDIAFSVGPLTQSLMRQLEVYPPQAKPCR